MNKKTFIIIRVSSDEKNNLKKAARESKNLSAFLLSSARKITKYRRLIEDVERFERVTGKSHACLKLVEGK